MRLATSASKAGQPLPAPSLVLSSRKGWDAPSKGRRRNVEEELLCKASSFRCAKGLGLGANQRADPQPVQAQGSL